MQGAERQAKSQRKQLYQIEDQLATAKEQIAILRKKLEKAKKAIEKAKQDDYKVGVAKTDEALRTKVSGVWNEALNQAGVEASTALRRVNNFYYPLAIRASSSLDSQTNFASKEADASKDSLAKAFPSSDSLPQVAT